MAKIVFRDGQAAYLLTDAADLSQWPEITDRGVTWRNGVEFEAIIMSADVPADIPLWRIRLVGDVVVVDPEPPVPAPTREARKEARTEAVSAIKVTVGGKVFDGDETSQTRMTRAIVGMQAAGVSTINWTLANNAVAEVTVAELTEALILAGQRQAELWVLPA